jgi:hypothetical protein
MALKLESLPLAGTPVFACSSDAAGRERREGMERTALKTVFANCTCVKRSQALWRKSPDFTAENAEHAEKTINIRGRARANASKTPKAASHRVTEEINTR